MDLIILVILGIGLVTGLVRGLVKQACATVGLVAGLLVARALYAVMGEHLAPHIGTSATVAGIISFIVIWAVVPVILMLAGEILTRTLEAVNLGLVNRLLGAAVGVLLYALLLGLVFKVVDAVDPHEKLISQETKDKSVFYYPVSDITGLFFPVIKKVSQHIIN